MSDSVKEWYHYFHDIAAIVSQRASCDRASVGCLLVKKKRIIATGYNGSISGAPSCNEVGHLMVNNHCIRTIHAEQNAILQAAKMGVSVDRCEVYVTHLPCANCFKLLASLHVKAIYFDVCYSPDAALIALMNANSNVLCVQWCAKCSRYSIKTFARFNELEQQRCSICSVSEE